MYIYVCVFAHMHIIHFQLSHLMRLRLLCPSISRQFSRQFSFPGKMSSGRGSRLTPESGNRRKTVGVDGPSPDVSTGSKVGYTLQRNIVSEHPKSWPASVAVNEEEWPSLSASVGSSSKAKRRTKIDLRTQVEQRSEERPADIGSSQLEASPVAHLRSEEENSLPTSFGKKHVPSPMKRHKLHKTYPEYSLGSGETDYAKGLPEIGSFDICLSKISRSVQYDYLNANNKEKRIEMEHSMERTGPVLRPGMVLLKSCITLDKQVQIVKICRELGIGPGGFYQPGYGDGAKLRLQMMCLGLDWDPETRKYHKKRAVDGSEPPGIPHEFKELVKTAIQDSHALIGNNIGLNDVEDLFPDMSPNICIVNFYTTNGRLGLHQDRDESKESICKGLPVVSFSVGDSAEFLYGDQRDVEKARKVQLESGDVLIFGGKSRNVFHGVKSIIPNSAPSDLLRKAKLRPGRLNLTFRQY